MVTTFLIVLLFSQLSYSRKKSFYSKNKAIKTLNIKSNWIKKSGKKIIYEPYRNRRRKTYYTYVFNANSYLNSVKNIKNPVLKVKIVFFKKTRTKNRAGTVTTKWFKAKILSVLSKNQNQVNKQIYQTKSILIAPNRYNELVQKVNSITYSPNASGIRRAYFKNYIFDKNDFLKKVGVIKKGEQVKVQIKFYEIKKRTYKPKMGQTPSGGFKHYYYKAMIEKVLDRK